MNYYQFNVGDYAAHTRHLSLIEDLAYRRMIDLYYMSEEPLPSDIDRIARLIGMRDHIQEISDVLSDFFLKSEEGYRHARCDKEIDVYRAKADRARSANNARWNGKKSKDDLKSDDDQIPTKNQEPRTINQEPEKREGAPAAQPPAPKAARATRLATDWRLPDTWMSWALLEQPSWTPDDALRVADSFRDYWAAKGGADARKVDWEATWRNWVRREKSPTKVRAQQPQNRQDRYAADAAIIRDLARGKTEIDMGTIDATR